MNIGDLYMRLRAEGARFTTEVVKEAEKAGDAGGKTLGSRMGTAAGLALRAGLAGLSAVAGFATKGLVELDNITRQFAADTGASAEEAKEAGKAILAMSKRNLQPLAEIGAALTKVHTDLGLTGDAAVAAAEQFLKFGRVTNRDAAEEVAAFDDILDAWGATADQIPGIMDQLVASHQAYGGSIAEDEAALKNLAPAMQAFGMDMTDTIGLLNLFKASGLDAGATQRAFNSALAKLPPGTDLRKVLEDIQAIEDPAQRAAAAIEIFGSRGGAGLANALAPGRGALEDFVITTDEARGAAKEAADVIDGSFTNQLKLRIKEIGGAILEAGQNFGPLVTGAAALASLGGSLGLDRVLGKAFTKLGLSGLVRGAATKAGLLIGAVFSAAMFAADKMAGFLGAALGKLPGAALVKKGASSLGGLLGSSLGKFAAAGFAAIMVLEVFNTYNRIKGELNAQLEQLSKDANQQLITGTDEALAIQKAALQKGIQDLNSVMDFGLFTGDARAKLEAELAATEAEIARRAAGLPPTVGAELAAGADDVAAGAQEGIVDPLTDVPALAAAAVKPTPRAIADSLLAGQFKVTDAIDAIKAAAKNSLSKTKEIAQLEGFLAGDELAKALRSKKPEVRAEAEAWKVAAEERLFALRNDVPNIAQRTGQNYADALEAKRTAIGTAASTALGSARGKFTAMRADAADWGYRTGANWVQNLTAAIGNGIYGTGGVYWSVQKVAAILRASSPPGPASPLHHIDDWAYATGAELPLGIARAISSLAGRVRGAVSGLAGIVQPGALANPLAAFALPGMASSGLQGQQLAFAGVAPAGNSVVVNGGIHVDARGATDPAAVEAAANQGVGDAMATVLRSQSVRGATGTRP